MIEFLQFLTSPLLCVFYLFFGGWFLFTLAEDREFKGVPRYILTVLGLGLFLSSVFLVVMFGHQTTHPFSWGP